MTDCDALAEKSTAEILKVAEEVAAGTETEGGWQRLSTLSMIGVIGQVQRASLEVQLDIRDAVTTWVAGDLSARSTAQQYRNTATEAIVKLLKEQSRKLTELIRQGPVTP